MFKLVTDEFGEVEVSFSYNRGLPTESKYSDITVCFIHDGNVEIGRGLARCKRADKFCKEIGRRISLTNALNQVGMFKNNSRELRRKFWNAYWFTKERDRAKAGKEMGR